MFKNWKTKRFLMVISLFVIIGISFTAIAEDNLGGAPTVTQEPVNEAGGSDKTEIESKPEEGYEEVWALPGVNNYNLISPNDVAGGNQGGVIQPPKLSPAEKRLKIANVESQGINSGGIAFLVLSAVALIIIVAPIFCKKKR